MIIAGDTGCQPSGSKVLMADGSWKNIEDVTVGEYVLSPQYDGSVVSNRITDTMKFKNRDIYSVKSRGRRQSISYRASHNHILPIIEVCGKKNRSRVINISIDDYNAKSENWKRQTKIFTSPAYDLMPKDFILHPYIVGVLLGDGSCVNHPSITSADPELFLELEKLGLKMGPAQKKIGTEAISRYTNGQSTKDVREVLSCDESHFKFVPKQYFLGSLEQRLELLAGLIDTDGTFEEFSSTSLQLARDFRSLVYSVGGVASINERTTSYNGGITNFIGYLVHYSFAENRPNVRLKRKQQRIRNMGWKNPRNIQFEVEYDKKDTVYGFTLDGETQWYITDDYIVTHNTGKSIIMHNIGVNAYLGPNNPFIPLERVAQNSGYNVLYFSLEMPKESIERRIDSCMGELYYKQIRDGALSIEDKKKYYRLLKFQEQYSKRFHIVDIPSGATTREIELKFVEIRDNQFKPDLVIVDYMGIMSSNNPEGKSDWEMLGEITKELHEFARVYEVPVITGSQVNRPKEAGKQEYSTNRIARSGMATTNANIIVQIGCRGDDEYLRSDMPMFITKMRDGEKGAFTLSKNFAKMKVIDSLSGGFTGDASATDDSI